MARKTTLRYGSTGAEVKNLQQYLNNNGAKLAVDGIFGANTQSAVRNYQKGNGLDVDGIVGNNTWQKLLYGSNTGNSGSRSAAAPTTGANRATGSGSAPVAAPTLQAAPTLKTRDNTKYDSTEEGKAGKEKIADLAGQQESYRPFGMEDFTQSDWMTDVYGKIQSRNPFSYDLNGDALYQQYKDKYIQQGKLAMGDAIGQASAMTGGYGNSYAQNVGQQQYQAQLNNLNDIVPELYQMALDKYNMEGQDLYNQYGLLSDLYDKEHAAHEEGYNRLMDSLGIYSDQYHKNADMFHTEQGIANDIIDAENNEALSIWDTTNDNLWKEAEFDRLTSRDEVADAQWQSEFDRLTSRDEVADTQWQKNYDFAQTQWEYQKAQDAAAKATTTNDSYANELVRDYTGTGGYDNGSRTYRQVEEVQAALGVTPDGFWGEESKKAAGGLTADEAYKKYILGEVDETEDDYADWDYGDWEGYFATIRNTESKSAAEEELSRMNKAGLIPKEFITAASIGARGSLGH